MNRLLNFRNLKYFVVLNLLLWVASSTATAQTNLIVNPDFENTSGFDYSTISEYTRVWSGGVQEGQFIHDVTSNGHGVGAVGWPNNLTGYGGSGYYLLFNGFGGSQNPTKAAWKQTIPVTPNTNYTFSAQVRNLAQGYMGVNPNPAKLRLIINNQQVGTDLTLPQHNNWVEWGNLTWNSGSATQANIRIVDAYTDLSSIGDDFGIDHLSFIAETVYSVTANPDNVSACLNDPENVYVLNNDIIQPNNIQEVTLQVVADPQYGICFVNNSNHYIQYIHTGGGTGTDQFKYRATYHGVTSEAWVFVTTASPPVVGNITAQGPICAGGVLNISVPTVNPSANGHWEYGASQTGTFQNLDPNNIPLSMNGKWVRYSASNDCGTGTSNAVQITVTNGPSWASGSAGQTPQLQPICAGQSLSLTPPTYSSNGSQILSYGWVASPTENGEYTAFSLNNISASYNGWYIRYMVEGSCGFIYSNPARQLTVNVAPSNIGTLQAPVAICAGDDLEVTAPTYDGTGTGVWEISQTQNGTYQSFNINNVPVTYNNWYLHYKVSNSCGSVTSNAVQIHVNEAPTIGTPATPTAICAGSSFNLSTPSIQNNGFTITDQGWQIAATQNGTYNTFNNNNVQYSSNGYWIRYYAVNECGETHSPSVQITVNADPIVGNITAPAGICAGQSFNLTTPSVQWRHTQQGTGSWEIAPTSSGDFTTLNNNNIPYTYNGYYLRYKAVNGCGISYSSNVVQVTVYSTEPTYDTITACDTYLWNGVTCDHTGNYQAQVQNANDCTITAHLHFIMSDAYTETQVVSECNSYYWPKNHVTYNNSGTYDFTVESGNPLVCDSIFTLNLTINRAPEVTTNIAAPSTICAGYPLNVVAPTYVMNHVEGGDAHWEYATSANGPFTPFDPSVNTLGYGTYYLRYAVVNGCGEDFSNVVQFHIDDMPEAHLQLAALQVCEGETLDLPEVSAVNVDWHNDNVNDRIAQWQMSPTQNGTFAPFDPATTPMQSNLDGYWLRFMAQNGCGIDIVGPVMITVLSTDDQWLETITACDSYLLNGQLITESTTVDMVEYEPCYHTVHQPVEINHSNYVVDPITSCHESYEWHGRIFYRSEQMQYAWDTLQNQSQCDSIIELNLSFDEYSSFTHTRVACGSYEWEMNPGHVYYESVRDSVFVPAVGIDDCDTWYYLELTVGHDMEIEGEPMTECSGFEWHGVVYEADAILYDSLQTSVTHCDSIITYRLTIIPPIVEDATMVSCTPVLWNGHFFEEDGDEYTATLTSMTTGCDSIVTMHFNLSPEIVMPAVDTLVCSAFVWNNELTITENGQWQHTFTTPAGCDSTVLLNVTFVQNEVLQEEVTACNEFTFHGQTYYPGTYQIYYDTLYFANGCDSIVHCMNLTVSETEQMGTISGSHEVYVDSDLIIGVYKYSINTEGIIGDIEWTLSNPEWRVLMSAADSCRILAATPGTAILTARFETATCGMMERHFEIHAGFFGLDENGMEVSIYPNPTKGTLTIEAEGIKSVRLVNMIGQTLDWIETDHADHLTMQLSSFPPSVYLLEIDTVNGLVKRRVVVCR